MGTPAAGRWFQARAALPEGAVRPGGAVEVAVRRAGAEGAGAEGGWEARRTVRLLDFTPPLVRPGAVGDLREDGFAFSVELDEPGRLAYLVLPAASAAPSAADVLRAARGRGGGLVAGAVDLERGGAPARVKVGDCRDAGCLLAGETYRAYLVAEDRGPRPNAMARPVALPRVELPDHTPPDYVVRPAVSQLTQDSVILSSKLNEPGTVHYVVVSDADGEPSVEDVIRGSTRGGAAPLAAGNLVQTARGQKVTAVLPNLPEPLVGKMKLYTVAQDDQDPPNVDRRVLSEAIERRMLTSSVAFIQGIPTIENVQETSFDMKIGMSENFNIDVAICAGSCGTISGGINDECGSISNIVRCWTVNGGDMQSAGGNAYIGTFNVDNDYDDGQDAEYSTGRSQIQISTQYQLVAQIRGTSPLVVATRTFSTADTTPPTLTLQGTNMTVQGPKGDSPLDGFNEWSEPGYAATDNGVDVSDQVVITGAPDMHFPDTYMVTYSVSDAAGNTATAIREVNVTGTWMPRILGLHDGTYQGDYTCCKWYKSCPITQHQTCTQAFIDQCTAQDPAHRSGGCNACLKCNSYSGLTQKKYSTTDPMSSNFTQEACIPPLPFRAKQTNTFAGREKIYPDRAQKGWEYHPFGRKMLHQPLSGGPGHHGLQADYLDTPVFTVCKTIELQCVAHKDYATGLCLPDKSVNEAAEKLIEGNVEGVKKHKERISKVRHDILNNPLIQKAIAHKEEKDCIFCRRRLQGLLRRL